jgi:dihydroorotate dehydrogenase (fumarate)
MEDAMTNLNTTYLGLELTNPLVASPSPLCEDIDNIKRMADAGAAAVVLHSLFEEQITLESYDLDDNLSRGTNYFAEALSYFPDMADYNLGPQGYLDHIRRAKRAVEIPIIGSLNGVSTGGWVSYAKEIQEAGADALELNIYYLPTDPETTGGEVEETYLNLLQNVTANLSIPVAVKLNPFLTAIPNMAIRLDQAGAGALVLFNRFYQPDIDLDELVVKPNLILSSPYELRLRLRWVAILYGHIQADMAVTGGIHTGQDVIKAMMVGAKVAMMTSALLTNGIDHLAKVRLEVLNWMEEHEYESIRQMQGSMSQLSVTDPEAFERANYMKVLKSYSR